MKLLLLLSTVWISFSSCGQDIPVSKVPSVVQNTVQARFPNAPGIEWEKKKHFYEAEFDIDSTEYTVYVDSAGKIFLYKMEIPLIELPAAIRENILREYPSYSIDDAAKLERNGSAYYQVEIETKGRKDKKMVFHPDGAMTKEFDFVK